MPLLATKLYVPPQRHNQVPRPRLIQQLGVALQLGRRLILVSAPAGFGKTTLLADWTSGIRLVSGDSNEIENRILWLSLDEEDNSPLRFWTYLVAAFQTAHTDLGQATSSLLQLPQLPLPSTLLTPLLNKVAALPETLTLVLDDYHLISAPQVHKGLAFLLDHQPSNLHLVIATRADPPLPIFRLRARGQLTELRSDDLRFTPDEAATFLNSTMDLGLTPEDVQALEARTEGWIVGLQLAALSLQGRANAHEFIAAFTGGHHYVLEYLTEEVVRCQSQAVQRFLMQTSILERLNGSLCDSLTGEQNGEAVLADLQRRNLFIVPLDDERRWYRYHHLFADLLSNLMRGEWPEEQIYELHHRASQWYEQHGSLDDAVKHALQAQDFDRAATLIEQAAGATMLHGRLTTLLGWIEALPEDLLHMRPRLRLHQGWAHSLSGRVAEAAEILHDAKRTLQALPPSSENDLLRGELAALLTGIATMREDTAAIFREAQEALAHLPEDNLVSRGRTYVALGTAYAYDNDMAKALETWQSARDLALEAGNLFLAAAAIEILAGAQIHQLGKLREGERTLQQVLELGTAPDGSKLAFAGTAHALLAEIYLEWNDLDAAEAYLKKGIELIQQGGIGYSLSPVYCTKARLCRAREDTAGALEALRTAEMAAGAHPLCHFIIDLLSCQVQTKLWLGDVEAALGWARGEPALTKRELPKALPIFLSEIQQISLARVYLAQGEPEQALAALDGLEQQAQEAGRSAHVIEICLLQALAWYALGKHSIALKSFERSLSLAEPEGYVRLYLEAGKAIIPLLSQAASDGIKPQHASKLLAAFGIVEKGNIAISQLPGVQPLVDPLTPRELEVLHLICDGLSNQEIAEQLTVTLNTVKKHSSNIYGKLDVTRRAQAIVRARELGLC